ncbi:MAG: hypothetical protein RR088_03525, partial [Clostridia bacterium]
KKGQPMKTRYPQRIDGCHFLPSPSDEPIKKRENKIIVIKNINNQKQTSEEVATIASEIESNKNNQKGVYINGK